MTDDERKKIERLEDLTRRVGIPHRAKQMQWILLAGTYVENGREDKAKHVMRNLDPDYCRGDLVRDMADETVLKYVILLVNTFGEDLAVFGRPAAKA